MKKRKICSFILTLILILTCIPISSNGAVTPESLEKADTSISASASENNAALYAANKVKTKKYTISKQAGTYSSQIKVKIKAKKGYKVYYSLNGKFKAKKVIKSKKKKTITISSTKTLQVYAVKSSKKITNKKLKAKAVKKCKNYTYTINRINETPNTVQNPNNAEENKVISYTVTFDTNGGTVIPSQSINNGSKAIMPANPTKEGYIFSGWYADEGLTVVYDFETTVSSDITLYASWVTQTEYVTVTFESNGGTPIEDQTIEKGAVVERPEDPVRENYVFDKWYIDSSLSTVYDFEAEVNEDITLYAKWIAEDDNLVDDVIDLGDIESMVSDGQIDVIYDENGNINTIDGPFTDEKINTVEDASELLNNSSSLFGDEFTATPENIVEQTASDGEDEDETFFRYSARIDGITVLGSQIVISTDEAGNVTGLFSSYNNAINTVNTIADIDSEEADEIGIAAVMEKPEVTDFLANLPGYDENAEEIKATFLDELSVDNNLMIYAADKDIAPLLVYAVTINKYDYLDKDDDEDIEETEDETISGVPVLDTTYYVYANGDDCGTIFKTIENSEGWSSVTLEGTDLLDEARTITGQEQDGTYRLKDTTRNLTTYKTAKTGALWWTEYILPGNVAKSTSFLGNEWINKAGVSAHANMSEVFDYYKNILGRNSFDGNGAAVKVSYDYGSDYENAYWTSTEQQFVFGSGDDYVAALDIVGHEYTHAVINYLVGNGDSITLTYSGESGALNEAYADIMGNLIEGKSGEDLWTHGEDKGSVTRSMSNPTAYEQPDHYDALSDPDWSRELDKYVNRDNEGVHIFSGVYCHAVYKMMTDSRCSNISNRTWSKVFYRSLYRLTTDADFLDGRGAVLCAAKNLGFNSSQQQAIKDAFDAVGIKEPDGIRIVLTWGETPRDLDSHLVGPGVDGTRFHVYYENRNYYEDGTYSSDSALYAVDLDYDDTTSYGPEITTIHTMTPGTYYFYVHDYTNGSDSSSTEMALSGATVKVYKGSGSTLIGSYTIDPSSSGTYWNVCELDISEDGNVSINEINTYNSYATLE